MNHENATTAGTVRPHYQLTVSNYDRAASTIVALLVLVGFAVICLLVIVYCGRIFGKAASIPVTLEQVAGRDNASLGMDYELEPMGAEEMPELEAPELQQTVTALSQAIAESTAMLNDEALAGESISSRGQGRGDRRKVGTPGQGADERVPRAERWKIRFEGGSLKSYARQLDFFGIELAVAGGGQQIHYAASFSQARPVHRTADPQAEQRLYFTWWGGTREEADRQLLARAGVDTAGGMLLQFYPAQLEAELAAKEKSHAGSRSVQEIRSTLFQVRSTSAGYEFYVADQRYF